MAQTVTADLFEDQVESKKQQKDNKSNKQWSLIKANKTVEEQMEYTLVVENKSKIKGVVQSKYPTNIY